MNVRNVKIRLGALLVLGVVYCCLAPPLFGQRWARSFGRTPASNDQAHTVQETADNGFLVGGESDGVAWLLKLTASGNVQWAKSFGATTIRSLQQTDDDGDGLQDDGFIVAGTINVTAPVVHDDVWVAKLDALGVVQWQRRYGGDQSQENDGAFSIRQTDDDGDSQVDDGFILAGFTQAGFHSLNGDFWVVKLDAAGTIQWHNAYGTTDFERAYGVRQTADLGYVVVGGIGVGGLNLSDQLVLKLDAVGAIQWQKVVELSPETGFGAQGVVEAGNGDLVVVGNSGSADGTGLQAVRFDATGGVVWLKHYFSPGLFADGAYAVAATLDNGLVVSGFYEGADLWILKLDSAGVIIWQRRYSGVDGTAGSAVRPTTDGGYILAATLLAGTNQFWVGRLEPNGTIDTSCPFPVDTEEGGLAPSSTVANASVTVTSGAVLTTVLAGAAVDALPAETALGCAACTVLTAPTQTSVDGQACGGTITTADATPALVWSDVSNEAGYEWQVWNGAGCSGSLVASGTTGPNVTTVSVAPALANGAYAWRVRAIGDGAAFCDSAWTCGCVFSVNTGGGCSSLIAPAQTGVDGQTCGGTILTTDNTPTLIWSNISNETGFEWEVWTGAGCTGTRVANGAVGKDITVDTVFPVLAPGTYYWRVRATGDGVTFCDSAWNCGCPFTVTSCIGTPISAPPPTSVDGQACGEAIVTSDTTPALAWVDVIWEAGYEWEVWSGVNCTGVLVASGTTGANAATAVVAPALADGTYYWRVRALGDGSIFCTSAWTCGCPFTVDTSGLCAPLAAPAQTSVAGQACGGAITTTDHTPALVWTDVANEIGFAWEVWTGAGCTGTRVASGATGAGVTTVTLSNGTYSWRVRATGDGATFCTSAWTCGCAFTISTPPPGGCVPPGSAAATDTNCDGCADGIDLGAVGRAFGEAFGDAFYNNDADFDADGIVGPLDLDQVIIDFGKGCS